MSWKPSNYLREEVIQNVSAEKRTEVNRYVGLHLWLLRLRMRSIIPAFLFFQGGTGMPGNIQGPAEEGAGGAGGTHQRTLGKMRSDQVERRGNIWLKRRRELAGVDVFLSRRKAQKPKNRGLRRPNLRSTRLPAWIADNRTTPGR